METLLVPLAAVVAPFATRWICRRLGLIRPNFRGDRIPAAAGITLWIVALVAYAAFRAWPFALVAGAFGLLGFWDDWRGDRSVGGFRGHLGALRRGRITTGAVKLLGGGGVAVGGALWIDYPVLWWIPIDAALIALCANTVNLLDLRPGRALFATSLLLTPSLVVSAAMGDTRGLLPALLLVPMVVEWPADARARVMLGDTGANLLGAVAGLGAAVCLPPEARAGLAVALLILNVAAERFSISKAIDATPWLRAIDRRLGARAPVDAPSKRRL